MVAITRLRRISKEANRYADDSEPLEDGAVYLSRAAIQLERLVRATDPSLAEASAMLGRWLVGYAIVLIVLVFALWDMVFKPGLSAT